MRNRQIQTLFLHLILTLLISQKPGFSQITDSVPTQAQAQRRFVFSPIIYYQPETSWAFGAGAIYYFKPANHYIQNSSGYLADSLMLQQTNASQVKSLGVYTLEKQVQIELGGDLYTRGNAYFVSFNLGYYRYPDSFFGIGNNTRAEDEERFTNTRSYFRVNAQKKIYHDFYGGVKTFFEYTKISGIDSGGIFDTQSIPGEEGGLNTGIGPWLKYDTRDHINYPTRGMVVNVSAVFHEKFIGSDFNYTDNLVEVSYFLNTWKRQVLAFNAYGNFNTGDVPFNRMAQLGGPDHLRGNYAGRFRDKCYYALQAEYRLPVWKIIGADFFYGLGKVGATIEDLSPEGLKYSYGAGLRINILPDDTYNLRIDYGFGSKGDHGLYVQFGEAF